MFGSLIESIRTVVEGEGKVDAIDKWARQQNRGNKAVKKQASRMRRQGNKVKIRKGEYDKVRDDVRGGYAS